MGGPEYRKREASEIRCLKKGRMEVEHVKKTVVFERIRKKKETWGRANRLRSQKRERKETRGSQKEEAWSPLLEASRSKKKRGREVHGGGKKKKRWGQKKKEILKASRGQSKEGSQGGRALQDASVRWALFGRRERTGQGEMHRERGREESTGEERLSKTSISWPCPSRTAKKIIEKSVETVDLASKRGEKE